MASRYRMFVLSHLVAGSLGLFFLPFFLAIHGQPGLVDAVMFSWFVLPLGIAVYLSFSGCYETAYLLSAANVTGILVSGSLLTGGFSSVLTPWVISVPIVAFFSGRRRLLVGSSILAVTGLSFLIFADYAQVSTVLFQHSENIRSLMVVASVLAIFIIGTVAFDSRQRQMRLFSGIHNAFDDMKRFIDESPDLLTWHSLDGRVRHVSAASARLLGVPADALQGDGMFEHIHFADQARFLKAVAQAGRCGKSVRLEYRIRRDLSDGRSDGQFIWVESICRLARKKAGADAGANEDIVLTTRDVHDRKMREQEETTPHQEKQLSQAGRVSNSVEMDEREGPASWRTVFLGLPWEKEPATCGITTECVAAGVREIPRSSGSVDSAA